RADPYLQFPTRAGDRPPHQPDAAQARGGARRAGPGPAHRCACCRGRGRAAGGPGGGVKPIARALADAARQLETTSDTARLDAELLMAEAFHIDRDKLILA